MQCSAILQNLHEAAMVEGHLPTEYIVGADNTRKETKNQFAMWFFVWLLCVLSGCPLSVITVVFLLVGHTHNKLDRLFSRISVALFGRDYFTVPGMLSIVRRVLSSELRSAHLGQVWDFKSMLDDRALPCYPRKMHNLDPAHAFRFTRSDDGIHMQWKQWCTDENWSRPIQLLAPHEIQLIATWPRASHSWSSQRRGGPI